MLLPKLAGFTNLCLLATKFGQSEHHLFRLQVLKLLVVDVAYPLVPQVDVRLGFLSFREHCGATVRRVEDEHPPISTPLHNHLAFFLNEAPEVCKPDLHPLVNDLSDRHQVLCDCHNVKHVHEFPFLPEMAQGNFSDIRDRMQSVVSDYDYSRLHRFFRYENHSLWLVI